MDEMKYSGGGGGGGGRGSIYMGMGKVKSLRKFSIHKWAQAFEHSLMGKK